MPYVESIVTLGIGSTPGSVRPFILLGLDVTVIPTPADRTLVVPSEVRVLSVDGESRIYGVPAESRVLTID